MKRAGADRRHHHFFLGAGLLTLALLAGCASQPRVYEDPMAAMSERGAWPDRQLEAARQARPRADAARLVLDDPHADPAARAAAQQTWDRYVTALNTLVWDRGYSAALRELAVNELVRIDEAGFRDRLRRRIVLIQNWDTLAHIFKVAAERGWDDFNLTLVRQYARPVRGMSEAQRPEREIIEKLNPGKTIEQVVFSVFAGQAGEITPTEQAAAWQLLCRLCDEQRQIELLEQVEPSSAMLIDLKAGAHELGVVPQTKEEMAWLMYLRAPERSSYWRDCQRAVGRLSPAQKQGLSLRHLHVLLHLDDAVFALERAPLIQRVEARLAADQHYLRGPEYDGPMREYPQRFHEAVGQLCWADLATIDLLLGVIRAPAVQQAWSAQARKDQADESTEYGGMLALTAQGPVVRPFEPQWRSHDLKYISSDELIEAMYTNLAHYHFHAQHTRNSDYAGPGMGDMKFAAAYRFNCLVVTSISETTLNVDYHQANGAVVDLGTVAR